MAASRWLHRPDSTPRSRPRCAEQRCRQLTAQLLQFGESGEEVTGELLKFVEGQVEDGKFAEDREGGEDFVCAFVFTHVELEQRTGEWWGVSIAAESADRDG